MKERRRHNVLATAEDLDTTSVHHDTTGIRLDTVTVSSFLSLKSAHFQVS